MKGYADWAFALIVFCLGTVSVKGQTLSLSLDETIRIAADSSLEAYRSRNVYLSGYWQYRTFRANRLPGLSLLTTPAEYFRDITRRYDSETDRDVFRRQQSFYSGGSLSLLQNLDLTGGSFFVESSLAYFRYFGSDTYNQFNSIPIRIGYSQKTIGYNPFKWERLIEPLKFERVKKELIYNVEAISEQTAQYFFNLAMARAEYDLARENVTASDTLYRTGMLRQKIAAISQADLLTLKLAAVNAQNALKNSDIALRRAMFALASYLNINKNTVIRLTLPERPAQVAIAPETAVSIARANNPAFLEMKQQVLEAEQAVDKTKKEARSDISIDARVGFNQVAENFRDVYHDPSQQQIVSLSVRIPILDWGVRKGKHNVAKNNLDVTKISARQKAVAIEEDVMMTVSDFNIQQDLIASAEEALRLAKMAYQENRQRFMIGKADISSLSLALTRQQEAQRNYISSLQNYWLSYYKIRRLTLYDFIAGGPLSVLFGEQYGM